VAQATFFTAKTSHFQKPGEMHADNLHPFVSPVFKYYVFYVGELNKW
jgi:hypothetical protein